MAGRPRRRARAELLGGLSDSEATDLARQLLPRINDTQLVVILAAAMRGRIHQPESIEDTRLAVADLLTSDPKAARLVVALHPIDAERLAHDDGARSPH